MAIPLAQLWIDGAPRAASTGRTYDVLNSGTQAVVSHAACASSEDAVAAVEAAAAAQPAWEATLPSFKRDIFMKAAQLIQSPKYVDRIVDTVQKETSATEAWSRFEVLGVSHWFRDAAGAAVNLRGEVMPSEQASGGTVLSERRPWGTVFGVAPFNSPINLAGRAVSFAIACGNTIVLKSSEVSPRCAEIVVEVLHEVCHVSRVPALFSHPVSLQAGLPKNVLNLLHVDRQDAPKIVAEIIAHKKIRHINVSISFP
jgi:acyl-CoA reductase-like NAD-dependent aldehyde dehydrogenase